MCSITICFFFGRDLPHWEAMAGPQDAAVLWYNAQLLNRVHDLMALGLILNSQLQTK